MCETGACLHAALLRMGSSCTRRIELFHGVVAQMFCKSSEQGAEMTKYRGEDIHKICDGGGNELGCFKMNTFRERV